MEAAAQNIISDPRPIQLVLEKFFSTNSEESTREIFWYLFKAWVSQPEDKQYYSNQEIALFFDQLLELVAAAYTLHQSHRANSNPNPEEKKAWSISPSTPGSCWSPLPNDGDPTFKCGLAAAFFFFY